MKGMKTPCYPWLCNTAEMQILSWLRARNCAAFCSVCCLFPRQEAFCGQLVSSFLSWIKCEMCYGLLLSCFTSDGGSL